MKGGKHRLGQGADDGKRKLENEGGDGEMDGVEGEHRVEVRARASVRARARVRVRVRARARG